MKVHSFAFDRFYDVIFDRFRNNELSDKQRNEHNSKSPEIWDLRNEGRSVFDQLFGRYSSDTRIFYRLRGRLRSEDGKYGSVNNDLLIAGLNYIDINAPDKFEQENFVDENQKAKILYQLFLEREFPAFLKSNPELKVYDKITNRLIVSENENRNEDQETRIEEKKQDYSGMDYNIIKAVNDFYHLVSVNKLDKAWNKLSSNFQRRVWKEKFEAFTVGYTNVIAINNVHVWDVHIEEEIAECKVYYLEKAAINTSIQLGHLDKLSLRDLDEFTRRMKDLMEKAADTDLIDFEKIEIQKFFEPTVSEYIWYKCGMNPESISKLLPNETTTVVPRLYSVSLSKNDDDWLLTSLTPIRYQLHR